MVRTNLFYDVYVISTYMHVCTCLDTYIVDIVVHSTGGTNVIWYVSKDRLTSRRLNPFIRHCNDKTRAVLVHVVELH